MATDRSAKSVGDGHNLTLVQETDQSEDLLAQLGDGPPLLQCAQVEAVCMRISKVEYRPFQQVKWVFDFRVFEPDEHAGLRLQMFARVDPRWKRLPVASKLWKVVQVASGGDRSVRRATKSLFVGKAFRCRVKRCGEGDAAYSTVEMIVEKLTG